MLMLQGPRIAGPQFVQYLKELILHTQAWRPERLDDLRCHLGLLLLHQLMHRLMHDHKRLAALHL